LFTQKRKLLSKKISINIFSHVANALLYAYSCVLSHTSYRFHQSRNFFQKEMSVQSLCYPNIFLLKLKSKRQ
jgi:hypothetical protein